MVPVIDAADGRWLLTASCKVMMKPGGHGAIWKLMHDQGEEGWLKRCFCFFKCVFCFSGVSAMAAAGPPGQPQTPGQH